MSAAPFKKREITTASPRRRKRGWRARQSATSPRILLRFGRIPSVAAAAVVVEDVAASAVPWECLRKAAAADGRGPSWEAGCR